MEIFEITNPDILFINVVALIKKKRSHFNLYPK